MNAIPWHFFLGSPQRLTISFMTCAVLVAGPAAAAELAVKDGLMLWLAADVGVTADAGGQVTGWNDQSGNGNNAAPRAGAPSTEAPTLAANVVNGKAVLRFDGQDDVLEIPNSATLQPQAGDWTVFFVAKRLAASQGDFPQVIGSRPWVSGLDEGWSVSMSSGGAVGSHYADGAAGHDVPAVLSNARLSQSAFQMWQVEENRAAGTTTFYANGDLDATRSTPMPVEAVDQLDAVYIGREIGGSDNRRANLELGEILVYNRVISKTERESISSYLSEKYGLGYSPNALPTVSITSPAGGASFESPASITMTASATDTDGSIRRVELFANNTLVAAASAPPFTVPLSIVSTGSVSLTAVATDNRGGLGTSAPVAITVTGSLPPVPMNVTSGLQLWLKADAGVTADETGHVSVWTDQSPNGNDALQDNALATPPENFQPLLVANEANGNPVIRFDGASSFMTIINSPSLQPQNGDWTILFAGSRGTPSQGDWPQIIGSRPWTAGVDAGWSLNFGGTSGLLGSHFADGTAGHDVGNATSASPLATGALQVWQMEENRTGGYTAFYLLGMTNRVVTAAMPTNAVSHFGDTYIGREVEGGNNRRANMDLAEMLVYNRALSPQEREQASTYLLRKYAVQQIFNNNARPTVTLTSPADGLTFNAPANVNLGVNATDTDGAVVSVAYYRGNALIAQATNSPFNLKVTLTGLGDSLLTAVATDNLGAMATSAPVAIKVIAPGIQLIGKVDYSDTFSLNATRTDGLYNNNANGAYNVETVGSNPAAAWSPIANFSFNTPASSTDPAKVGAATGNTGAAGGLAQTGGGDFSLPYGLQSNFVVQVDAIVPTDRLDISTLPVAGGNIFSTNSLTVFLRRDSATTLPGIGLFNGATETGVTNSTGAFVRTGVSDNNWHSFAVQFNQPDSVLRVYVDGVLISTVNLATFADGLYQNFSTAAVGVGGSGGVFWLDNFKVGAPPELIATVDYSDNFTLGEIRTDGLIGDDSGGAYTIENTQGNPAVTWTPASAFRFVTPASAASPDLVAAASANNGAATGLIEFGGDASIGYGLRDNYVVQFDAILPSDRLDITSVPQPGGGIFAANSLSVFLRRDSTAGTPHSAFPDTGLPAIGLYNGNKESAVTDAAGNLIFTGVDDNNWHNYAVHFNQATDELGIYVDRILKVTVNLATFAEGAYNNYSNGAVGMGGASLGGGNFWVDNFKVGAPAAQPPPQVTLSIARDAAGAVITWTGSGTLESADALDGTWTPLPTATSPYPITTTAAAKYYRVKQ